MLYLGFRGVVGLELSAPELADPAFDQPGLEALYLRKVGVDIRGVRFGF
jgi:hypothetical protein